MIDEYKKKLLIVYLDTKKTNKSLFLNYIDHQINANSPLDFFDFPEPKNY